MTSSLFYYFLLVLLEILRRQSSYYFYCSFYCLEWTARHVQQCIRVYCSSEGIDTESASMCEHSIQRAFSWLRSHGFAKHVRRANRGAGAAGCTAREIRAVQQLQRGHSSYYHNTYLSSH